MQSLAFVLTVPVFIMVMMLIVQVSQLMIGTITVHYAAYAAARSASVWIAADTRGDEGANRISSIVPTANVGIPGAGQSYRVASGSPKFRKIQSAAQLACAAISPSRNVGYADAGPYLGSLRRVYQALDPQHYRQNTRISQRLQNKLAYSLANTRITIGFLHKADEPALTRYNILDDPNEFRPNEVGWQDPIKVTVIHQFALLPGPGRLLFRPASGATSQVGDPVSQNIRRQGKVYTRELRASVIIGNEGEKSGLPYKHNLPP